MVVVSKPISLFSFDQAEQYSVELEASLDPAEAEVGAVAKADQNI